MFRKFSLIVCMVLIFNCQAYADSSGMVDDVRMATNDTTLSADSANPYYTKAFRTRDIVRGNHPLGIMYKADSGGTVNLSINLQQSYDKPDTEGLNDVKYVTIDNVVAALSDENWHVATCDTITMPWARFVIQGGSTNSATTELQIKVVK